MSFERFDNKNPQIRKKVGRGRQGNKDEIWIGTFSMIHIPAVFKKMLPLGYILDLYFDVDTKQIGFKPTLGGRFKLGVNRVVYARSFLVYHGIPLRQGVKAAWSEDHGMLITEPLRMVDSER